MIKLLKDLLETMLPQQLKVLLDKMRPETSDSFGKLLVFLRHVVILMNCSIRTMTSKLRIQVLFSVAWKFNKAKCCKYIVYRFCSPSAFLPDLNTRLYTSGRAKLNVKSSLPKTNWYVMLKIRRASLHSLTGQKYNSWPPKIFRTIFGKYKVWFGAIKLFFKELFSSSATTLTHDLQTQIFFSQPAHYTSDSSNPNIPKNRTNWNFPKETNNS